MRDLQIETAAADSFRSDRNDGFATRGDAAGPLVRPPKSWLAESFIAALPAVFFFVLAGAAPVDAAKIGKYLISGAVEAEVRQETETRPGQKTSYNSFEHRYKFDVQSFVLDPRILTYQLGLSVTQGKATTNGDSSSIDDLGYNARAELFSGRRISGSFYAQRAATSSFIPQTSSAGSIVVSQTNTNYGAMFNMNLKALPMTLSYDENQTQGVSGALQIDKITRRVQWSANKDFKNLTSRYGYTYTDTADKIEPANNSAEHTLTANLEKKLSTARTFRQDVKFSSLNRLGAAQDITSRTVTKNTDYSLTRDDQIVRFDAVMGNLTAMLPSALGDAGRTFTIVKIDATANRVTVRPFGAETIGGASSLVLQTQWAETTVISNGVNWIIGGRDPRKEAVDSRIINLHSTSNLSYRPSSDFSNDSSLNLYYFDYGGVPGTNILFSNATNLQLNPDLSVNANLSGGFTDSGTGATAAMANASTGMNYGRKIGEWRFSLFENAGISNSNQSSGQAKATGNVGVGGSLVRDYDWWNSSVTLQTQAVKSVSSGGARTDGWQSSAAWSSSPSERLQLHSNLRYSSENSQNEVILIAGDAAVPPSANSSRTAALDMNYSWLAYVSENKMATMSGGAVFSKQESQVGIGGGATTDRNYFYNQIVLKVVPLRSLFISMTLRGEWDNSSLNADDAKGTITTTSQARTVYSMENALNFRVRKILIELTDKWREETGGGAPYSRQSIYLKITRPF